MEYYSNGYHIYLSLIYNAFVTYYFRHKEINVQKLINILFI